MAFYCCMTDDCYFNQDNYVRNDFNWKCSSGVASDTSSRGRYIANVSCVVTHTHTHTHAYVKRHEYTHGQLWNLQDFTVGDLGTLKSLTAAGLLWRHQVTQGRWVPCLAPRPAQRRWHPSYHGRNHWWRVRQPPSSSCSVGQENISTCIEILYF